MSDDLIRRSDAIKAIKRVSENYTGKGKRTFHPHIDFLIDELKYEVPSADRPQGAWIMSKPEEEGFGAVFKCSRCSCEVDCVPTNFCPNCGARMKGADDFVKTHEVVANGNCAICGKPLSGDRVFVCEECNNKGYVLLHQKVEGADDETD